MNIAQAMNILKPDDSSFTGLKKSYREAAMKYHPDRNPDGLELMKLVNAAYEFLKDNLGKWSVGPDEYKDSGPSIDEIFADILAKIRHLPDIKIEVCGVWLWVTGNTKPYKSYFKSCDMYFSPKKCAWYWKPKSWRPMSKRKMSLEEIRQVFGSQEVENEPFTAI